MTDNQDLLAMTHLGEDPSKYMTADFYELPSCI